MKIYVASSWKNTQQHEVVAGLRAAGHEVYDFKNPAPGDHGFSWKQITSDPPPWSAGETFRVLCHPVADHGFDLDFSAMKRADACVMLQPCGRSAAMELGWMAGAGKFTIVQLAHSQEPELMVKMASHITTSLTETIAMLKAYESELSRKPSEDHPAPDDMPEQILAMALVLGVEDPVITMRIHGEGVLVGVEEYAADDDPLLPSVIGPTSSEAILSLHRELSKKVDALEKDIQALKERRRT